MSGIADVVIVQRSAALACHSAGIIRGLRQLRRSSRSGSRWHERDLGRRFDDHERGCEPQRRNELLETADHSELRIYTTTYETNTRLYTLVHNPAYRNHLAVHGYKQSHLVDYFLGFGMSAPPAPKIRLVARQ